MFCFIDSSKYFPLWYRIKNRILFQVSSYLSDINLTVSKYSKEQILKHFKSKQSLYLIPNAVEDKYFESYNKEQVKEQVLKTYNLKNYYLFVSRREPLNHLNLLKLCKV